MTRICFRLLAVIFLTGPIARAGETNPAPDFQEVYELLRAHLAGTTDADLNRAAVEGLVTSLHGQVTLLSDKATAEQTNVPPVSKSALLESDVAYVRVGRVENGLAKALQRAIQQLGETNQLIGAVLDLRYAGGDDYAAVTTTAELFLTDAKPLLDWGTGIVKSKQNDDAIKLPVAVLVNRETSGAAEALAAVLRETGTALILGSATAGHAMVLQQFTLKDGQRLRVATSPVKLGDGTALPSQGVKPDIEVSVGAVQERAYFEDAYARLAKQSLPRDAGQTLTNELAGTNRPSRRPRATEADLVRAHREGLSLDLDSSFARDTGPDKPLIRDPSLARAVDVLKGLAVVRQARP